MTTARRLRSYNYDQYLHALADSQIKLEYFEGEIYAIAGGTLSHAELGARALFLLQRTLPKGCSAYTSDLKVLVERADLATFSDGSVVCGAREAATRDENAITNPALLVEITSASTESYDRGEKLRSYQQLPSLRAVLIVSHRASSSGRCAWPTRCGVGTSVTLAFNSAGLPVLLSHRHDPISNSTT